MINVDKSFRIYSMKTIQIYQLMVLYFAHFLIFKEKTQVLMILTKIITSLIISKTGSNNSSLIIKTLCLKNLISTMINMNNINLSLIREMILKIKISDNNSISMKINTMTKLQSLETTNMSLIIKKITFFTPIKVQ